MDSPKARPSIFAVDGADLGALLAADGIPAWRARQVLGWVYGRATADPALMTDLPRDLRARLPGLLDVGEPPLAGRLASPDGATMKVAWRFRAGEAPVEAVLMRHEERRPTLCVSSQLGCGLGCTFCRTGSMGLTRDLATGELVFQVWALRRELTQAGEAASHNVVFMGMGEPLANRTNLGRALRLINAGEALGVSWRRLTVSTAGVLEGIRWLAREFPQVNLAVSLNAPDDGLRRRLMPSHPRSGLAGLVHAVTEHYEATHRLPTFEYVLLRSVNDAPAQAAALAALLRGLPCLVNLIPYNPGADGGFEPSPPTAQRAFLLALRRAGQKATLRRSSGRDILAACGQLASAGNA